MKVFVYRNLRDNLWSVKAMGGEHNGRVVLHAAAVVLTGATFKVSEVGRQRVLREKQKNVHAGVVGHLELADVVTERYDVNVLHMAYPTDVNSYPKAFGVTYNPYVGSTFTYRVTGKPVVGSGYTVVMDSEMKVHVA